MGRLRIGVVVAVAGLAGVAGLQASRTMRPHFRDTQEMMTWLSSQAVSTARLDQGVVLDFSPHSIERVERVLGSLHEQYKRGQVTAGIDGLAIAYGAYVGEVIRKSQPGSRWGQDNPIIGPWSYSLAWHDSQSFPCAWCYSRIVKGPVDNVWSKYLLLESESHADPAWPATPVDATADERSEKRP